MKPGRAVTTRWSLAMIAVCAVASTSTALAQSAAWLPPSATPGMYVPPPEEEPRRELSVRERRERLARARQHRDNLFVGAALTFALTYGGAIAWGVHYRSSLRLGPPECNDQYADLHFVPLVGPIVGLVLGGECVRGTLHPDELAVSAVATLGQLAGVLLLLVGAFRDLPDLPTVHVSADASHALVTLGGTL